MTHTAIPADAVEQTVALVFQTTLELEAYPLGPGALEDAGLTGRVVIQSDPSWQLTLEASLPVARRLAGRFLGQDPDVIVADDVSDAFGEITNMVAGNFKSAFVPGSRISAHPEVFPGTAGLETGDCFACEDGTFRVSLTPAP